MTLRLLLDENISPFLTVRLTEMDVFAQAVAHIGLRGQPDRTVWAFAMRHEMAVVTTNADDFIDLLEDVELHPGLILLRESGLSREQQWARLEPVIRFVQSRTEPDYLVNRVIDILGPGRFLSLVIPELLP
jgi:predicted nuclease of predicted toxin-antitoxin system